MGHDGRLLRVECAKQERENAGFRAVRTGTTTTGPEKQPTDTKHMNGLIDRKRLLNSRCFSRAGGLPYCRRAIKVAERLSLVRFRAAGLGFN